MNKYTVGGAILGIVLLATLGIRSASSWLSRSTPDASTSDRIAAANNNDSGDPLGNDADQLNSQSDGIFNDQFNDQTISQADDSNGDDNVIDSANQSFDDATLEEAGSYIQRQKRVEEDGVIAETDVNVIPNADAEVVSAQGNTAVDPQPTAPEPVPSARPVSPTTTTTTATTPEPVAVPALW